MLLDKVGRETDTPQTTHKLNSYHISAKGCPWVQGHWCALKR